MTKLWPSLPWSVAPWLLLPGDIWLPGAAPGEYWLVKPYATVEVMNQDMTDPNGLRLGLFQGGAWRLVSIGSYGGGTFPTELRYVAVWRFQSVVGPTWDGYFGLTLEEALERNDLLGSAGLVPTMVAATPLGGTDRYGAIFEARPPLPNGLPRFDLLMDLSHELLDGGGAWPGLLAKMRAYGQVPRWLATCGGSANRRYAIVVEQLEARASSYWSVDLDRLAVQAEAHMGAPWEPVTFSFTGADHYIPATELGWARADFIHVNRDGNKARYSTIFQTDHVGDTGSLIEVPGHLLQSYLEDWAADGFFPFRLQAGGWGNGLRFAIVLAKSYDVTPRSFRIAKLLPTTPPVLDEPPVAAGPKKPDQPDSAQAPGKPGTPLPPGKGFKPFDEPPEYPWANKEGFLGFDEPPEYPWADKPKGDPEELDEFMKRYMKFANVRGASLAVVKDGRLVFARGYTWAEPDYPDVKPRTAFRLWSVCKPLTAIACIILANRGDFGGGGLDAPFTSILDLKQPDGSSPADQPSLGLFSYPWDKVTIRQLLNHVSGLQTTAGFGNWSELEVLKAIQKVNPQRELPVEPAEVASYLATSSDLFVSDPAVASYAYCNRGYLLLGQTIAAAASSVSPDKTYIDFMNEEVFKKLDIAFPERVEAARGHFDMALGKYVTDLIDEGRYHGFKPSATLNPTVPGAPLGPLSYFWQDMVPSAASGGFAMSAIDVARILASFDLPDNHPKRLMSRQDADQVLFNGFVQGPWGGNTMGFRLGQYMPTLVPGFVANVAQKGGGAPSGASNAIRWQNPSAPDYFPLMPPWRNVSFVIQWNGDYTSDRPPMEGAAFGWPSVLDDESLYGIGFSDPNEIIRTIVAAVTAADTWPDYDLFEKIADLPPFLQPSP